MKSSNKKLYWLVLVFIVPMIVSRMLFHFHDHFQFKTTNHGALINPPVQFQALSIPSSEQSRQWQIVYIPRNCSDERSQKMMFTLHQVRAALGKGRNRVSLALAVDDRCELKELHDFRKITLKDADYIQLQNLLPESNANKFAVKDKIYLIDPIGNLFMYYSVTDDPMNILKDMKHLLEVSQIG